MADSLALLVSALLATAPPPAELLSESSADALNLSVSDTHDQAAWDALTPRGRKVMAASLSKARPIKQDKQQGPRRGLEWSGRRKVTLVEEYNAEERRWSLRVKRKEPASPSAASDMQASISPKGEWIAFVSGRSGRGDIYMTPTHKTNQAPKRVTSSPDPDLMPSWSPDGQSLLFLRASLSGRQLILLDNAVGGGSETVIADERVAPLAGAFRPDGREIALYGRNWSSATMLYVASPGLGSPVQRLGDVRAQPGGPAWLERGDKWLLVTIRNNDSIVMVDPIGDITALQTGTFGHGEVRVAKVKGQATLVFTALGLSGEEQANTSRRRVYKWTIPTKLLSP